MASFSRSEYIDNLTVNNIFTPPIPAFQFLVTDGLGGTSWTTISSLSSLIYGASYHTIKTSVGTYNADQAAGATFSLLDGPNAGLINDPTASNTVHLYAKAFGKFDISGSNSLSSYDPVTQQVNSNVLFVGTGGITIMGDPQTNTMYFDGRDLPFVSTVPYSFNQMRVFSNVPGSTSATSNTPSITIQPQGPSSVLSFVGEDMVVIKTSYEKNQIMFSLSSLNLALLSTLVDHDKFLMSTSITSTDLSTVSTLFGIIPNLTQIQNIVCTMSTTIDDKIAYNSTIIGDVNTYSLGISTTWRQYVKERYIFNISAGSAIVSTSSALQSEIDQVSDRLYQTGRILTTSTVITPYFWASTMVDLFNAFATSIANGSPSVGPLNVTYYPTYNSYYNLFNDTRPFGKPIQPIIYESDINLASGNAIVSTMSTVNNIKFSSMYAIQGTFAFYPNQDPHPFSVSWKGNLSLNINGSNYTDPPTAYPRLNKFASTESNISTSIIGQPICLVNFSYSKVNASDYLRFTNFTDFVDGPQTFNIAPIFNAYGYNTREAPLFSESITSYPKTFATVTSVAPYLQLSTYVMVASTFYTAGCNTQFPINASGYKSITFFQSTTNISKIAFTDNLSNNPPTPNINAPYSASNAFGYTFNSAIPNSPYTLQLVYGRQDPNNNSLTIGSIYNDQLTYRYTPLVYVSSVLTALTISSFHAQFISLSTTNLNTLNASVSSLNVSSLVAGNATLFNASIQSSLITNLVASSISSTYANISQLQVSSIVASNVNIRNLVVSSISSTYANVSMLQVSSVVGYSGQFSNINTSNLSSFNATFTNIKASSISSSYIYASDLTISSINNHDIYNLIYGGTDSSTVSTLYTNILQLTSTISSSIDSFSTSLVPVLYDIIDTSTVSTIYTNILLITSTIDSDLSTFSSSLHSLGTGGPDTSTISTLFTSINLVASTIEGDLSTFSSSLVYPGEIYTSTLFTSSIQLAGLQQPFIQYGYATTGSTVTLPKGYKTAAYVVQTTYSNNPSPIKPISVSIAASNSFTLSGDVSQNTFWTTYGNIF
jgi:hypothetical protein